MRRFRANTTPPAIQQKREEGMIRLVLCAGVILFSYVYLTFGSSNAITAPQRMPSADHKVLVEALRASTLQGCGVKKERLAELQIVEQPRSDLVQKFQKFRKFSNPIVVVGAPGSGKTALIQKALCETKGVVKIRIARSSATATDFDRAVVDALAVVSKNDKKEANLRRALQQLKKETQPERCPPTFVFAVDSNVDSHQVQDLLVWSRYIQHEYRLAQIVIDVSHAALVRNNLNMNPVEERIVILNVPSMSKSEAKGMLKSVVSEDDANYAVANIGCLLPMRIENLVGSFHHQRRGEAKSFQQTVDNYAWMLRKQMSSSAHEFLMRVNVKPMNMKNAKAKASFFLNKMGKGESVSLGELSDTLEARQDDIIKADSWSPHLFQVDLDSKSVSFSSTIARDALLFEWMQRWADKGIYQSIRE